MENTIFPPAVAEVANSIAEALLSQKEFTYEYPNCSKDILTNEFGQVLFELWMNGEELILDRDVADHTLKRCVALGAVQLLLKEGLIDLVEDADGNEFVYITPAGKSFINPVVDEDVAGDIMDHLLYNKTIMN
jgi:hypothetical protein